MASTIQGVKIADFVTCLPANNAVASQEAAYRQNRHRVYALAFWLTDNEVTAEELMVRCFRRAFAQSPSPEAEAIDRALIAEARVLTPLGTLTLHCGPAQEILNVRRNTLRVHLERAVVQVPATERLIFLLHDAEGYDHARIARTLSISQDDSRRGLHQARLRMRELLSRTSD